MTELRWLALLSGGHSECFEDRPVQRVNVVLSRGVLALEAELACVRRSWSKTLAQRRTVERRNFLNPDSFWGGGAGPGRAPGIRCIARPVTSPAPIVIVSPSSREPSRFALA